MVKLKTMSKLKSALYGLVFIGIGLALSSLLRMPLALAQTANSYLYLNGNVGIGTSSPTQLLSVGTGTTSNFTVDGLGNVNFNGNLTKGGQPFNSGLAVIQDITLSSNGSYFTFSNIPQTYHDLMINLSGGSAGGAFTITMQINGSNSGYYDSYSYSCCGGTVGGSEWDNTAYLIGGNLYTMANSGVASYTFPNYSSSSIVKGFIGTETGWFSGMYTFNVGGSWFGGSNAGKSPITSLSINGNFGAGSRATLYGL